MNYIDNTPIPIKDYKGVTIKTGSYFKTRPEVYCKIYSGIVINFKEHLAIADLYLIHTAIDNKNYYFRSSDIICISKQEFFLLRLESV